MKRRLNKELIKFYYKTNFLFESGVKSLELNNNKINGIFKYNISRFKINECNNPIEYLEKIGFEFKKCNFCGDYAAYDIKFKQNKNNFEILDITYPFNNYCKNKNKRCEGIKYNPNSVKFVSITRNITGDQALKIIKSRNKSPFYKENFDNYEDYKKAQTRDLEYYIKKYGEKGNKMFDNYLIKLKYTHSEKYYVDKFGVEEGKKYWDFLSSLKDSVSYAYFLKLYNNDEKLASIEYNKRIEILKNTLENFKYKYGEDIGNKKYNDFINKKKQNYIDNAKLKVNNNSINLGFIGTKVSKSSIHFFDSLVKALMQLNILNKNDVMYGKNEKAIYNELSQTCYFYDCFIKKYKLIIEFNGFQFHPKCLNDVNFRHAYDKVNDANYYFNKDLHKIETAKKYGYNIIIVWDDDKHKLETCIKQIKETIKWDSN